MLGKQKLPVLLLSGALYMSFGDPGYCQVFGETSTKRQTVSHEDRLRHEIDSLKKMIFLLERDSYYSTWRGLGGLEDDEWINGIPIMSLSANATDAAYMREVLPENSIFAKVGYDQAVRDAVEFYTVSRHRSMGTILARYDHFYPVLSNIFRHYNVPEELIGLCIVESAVSRTAYSNAGAAGMWQFMQATAADYGLRINEHIDERYDMILSAHAAAKYLRDLCRSCGGWDKAVLAYNCGPERLRQAYIRSGRSENLWDVIRFLPKETQAYLPSLLAANYTSRCREALDIPKKEWKEAPLTAVVYKGTTLQEIADKTGFNIEYLKKINPQLLDGIIPDEGAGVYLPDKKQ